MSTATTMSAEMLVQARGLNTYYGASHILRGIDFHVKRGETIGLMGRNGMGKSTLLKSIMGLVKPRGGEVRIKNQPMTGAALPHCAAGHCLCARGSRHLRQSFGQGKLADGRARGHAGPMRLDL